MERTLRLATKANLGDSKALEELGVSDVAPVDFQKIKSIDKSTLQTIMTLCAKGAMAGKVLGIDILEKSALHVMEMTQLVADNELKAKLDFYVDKDDVLKRMGVVCKQRWQWLCSLGEEEGGPVNETITWLSQTIAYARQGNASSQKLLQLTRLPRLSLNTQRSTPQVCDTPLA